MPYMLIYANNLEGSAFIDANMSCDFSIIHINTKTSGQKP
jgi:hypothetical protein